MIATVSLIASILTISQIFGNGAGDIEVVRNSDSRIALTADAAGLIKADRISVPDTVFLASSQLTLVANEIVFSNNAVLSLGNEGKLVIVASRITGGAIDVSGDSASIAGEKGGNAGRITIRAGIVEGTQIRANGGDGTTGQPGLIGSPGRRGRCAGFGQWRAAGRGEPGQSGTSGGNGGNGGIVDIRVGELLVIPIVAEGGKGGRGGAGGQGGPGGDGCTGLGGTQRSKGQGPPGTPGKDGTNGNSTPPRVTTFDFPEFAKKIRKIEISHDAILELIQ